MPARAKPGKLRALMKFRISRSLVLWLGLPGLVFIVWMWIWSMFNNFYFNHGLHPDHQIQLICSVSRLDVNYIHRYGEGPPFTTPLILRRVPHKTNSPSLRDWFPMPNLKRTHTSAETIADVTVFPTPSGPPSPRLRVIPPGGSGPAASPPPTRSRVAIRASTATQLLVPHWSILIAYLGAWSTVVFVRWVRAARKAKAAEHGVHSD